MFANLRTDLSRSRGKPSGLWRVPFRFIWLRGFRAVCFFRMASWFSAHGLSWIGRWLSVWNEEWHTVAIHPGARVGPGLVLPHAFGVIIGAGTTLDRHATVFNNVVIGPVKGQGSPTIGPNLIAFAGAQIVGAIRVGENVVVGANAVVIVDVPDDHSVLPPRAMQLKRSADV